MADFATVAEAEIIFSESLEQLASSNGADMHKYNLIYTFKINQHVLTPESYDVGVKRYFAPNAGPKVKNPFASKLASDF